MIAPNDARFSISTIIPVITAPAGIVNPKLVTRRQLLFWSQHGQCVTLAYRLSEVTTLPTGD